MNVQNRRGFLRHVAAGSVAASLALSGTKSSGRPIGANDRVRVAVAGIHGRGQVHMQVFGEMKDVEVAYLVDPDSRLFASRSAAVTRLTGSSPRCVQDVREALDDKTLDAVSIATPNHWHALMAIWACQAGKDVYLEKPCSHNIVEGRRTVEAARHYDRIVQHGVQWRSDPSWRRLMGDIRGGKYGKLRVAYINIIRPRESIGSKQPEQPPRELDYNLWVGPAPMSPYRTNLVHYQWHWMWDYGTGEIGNLGSHQFEMARWALSADAAPQSVTSLGGRFGYQDQGETPNTQLTVLDFGEAKMFCEQRGLAFKQPIKMTIDFYTDEGVVKDGKFYPKGKPTGEPIEGAPAGGLPENFARAHFRNFIDCVRSRKREELNGEILEGHRTALLAHLGNISYRLGEETPFSQQPKGFADDRLAHEPFEDMKRHLVEAAGLKLDKASYRLGRTLRFDAQAEEFIGSPEADRLLGRPYREPFAADRPS